MKQSPKKKGVLLVPLFYLLLLAAWQCLASLPRSRDYLFPSPVQVGRRMVELARDHMLWPSLAATLRRMGIGFSISAALGLIIGAAMGTSAVINRALKS